MSRRDVPCLVEGHQAFVGWDPPLRTFFAQVIRIDPEDADVDALPDPVILWVGATARVPDLTGLVQAVNGYAQLDPEILRQLFRDKELDR